MSNGHTNKFTDYYEYLNISKDATVDEIKQSITDACNRLQNLASVASSSEAKLMDLHEELVYKELVFEDQLNDVVNEDKDIFIYTNKLLTLQENLPLLKRRCVSIRKALSRNYKDTQSCGVFSIKLWRSGVYGINAPACVAPVGENRSEIIEKFITRNYPNILSNLQKYENIEFERLRNRRVINFVRLFTFYITQIDRIFFILNEEIIRYKCSTIVRNVQNKCQNLKDFLRNQERLSATKEVLEDISNRQSFSVRRHSSIIENAADILLHDDLRSIYKNLCKQEHCQYFVTKEKLVCIFEDESDFVIQLNSIESDLKEILSTQKEKFGYVRNSFLHDNNKYWIVYLQATHFLELIKNQVVLESLKSSLETMEKTLHSVGPLIDLCCKNKTTVKRQYRHALYETLQRFTRLSEDKLDVSTLKTEENHTIISD